MTGQQTGKGQLIAGHVLSGLVILFLLFDAGLKLVSPETAIKYSPPGLGWPLEVGTMYLLGTLLLIPTLLAPGPGRRLLGTGAMKYIGDRSYSIYLVQGMAGVAVAAMFPKLLNWPTLNWIGVGLVSLALADLLLRYVEQPLIEVGRNVVNRRKKAEPVAAAEPALVPQPA